MKKRALPNSYVVTICGIAVCVVADGVQPNLALADKSKPAAKSRIAISRETTFFTQPVDAVGYVDYVAALNEHFSKGVTADNNAVVPLLRAFGPGEIPKKLRPEFFKRLGMKPLPEEGAYFWHPDFKKIANPRKRMQSRAGWNAQWDKAISGPWKRNECPEIAKWLDKNEEILELIERASRRPRFYLPFVVEGKERQLLSIPETTLAVYPAARTSIRLLSMRANLHIGEGRVEEAAFDLLTGHRLARVVDRNSFMIGSLVAYALESVAAAGDLHLAHSGHLTAKQALAYRKQLDAMRPLNNFAGNFNIAERCFALDFCTFLARDGLRDVSEWEECGILPKGSAKELTRRFDDYFDSNIVLKEMNRRVDRVVKVAAIREPGRRRIALQQLRKELEALIEDAKQLPGFLTRGQFRKADRERASLWLSHVMSVYTLNIVTSVLDATDKANTRYDESRLTLALAAYHADHGKYPAELTALAPKYINSIPPDRFTGKPLIYKRTKTGYLLYSVGVNGQDDGGERRGPQRDDVAVRTPKR